MLVKSKSAKPYVIFREARKKVSNDFGLATKVVNEMFPIADSCAQSDRPYIVYGVNYDIIYRNEKTNWIYPVKRRQKQ